MIMLALNLAAVASGMLRFRENEMGIAANTFWALFHSFILAHIFIFNRETEPES